MQKYSFEALIPPTRTMANDTDTDKLTQLVQFLKGVGANRAELLNKMGVRNAADLLFLFPNRYENFTDQSEIAELQVDQIANIVGVVDDIEEQKSEGRHVLYVLLKQPSGYLRGIWFNQAYMLSKFRFGQTIQFRGKVAERGGGLQMTHPQVCWIDDLETMPDEHWQPVYPLTEGINQRQMRQIVSGVVEEFADLVVEAIPEEIQIANKLCDIGKAIRKIHAPKDEQELEFAKRRLVFQELLVLQLALSMRRHNVCSRSVAPEQEMTPKIRARILGRMPFELRESQRKVLEEIGTDMGRSFPMNRLLHGEVGSGKTVVSACAMMLSVAHGYQSALMAPTEILANQHLDTLRNLLAGSRVRIELLTGSLTHKKRREVIQAVESGEVNLLIGTTAVLSEKVNFAKLGLVVIDEQHKFGVRQRASLKQAGFDPHYLVMSATPIPRTMTMTLFGDLDVSTLRKDGGEVPNVKTYLGNDAQRKKWWEFFRKKLTQGRQGYVVAPFVDSKSDSRIQSAEEVFEALSNGPLEAFRLAILHGRQSPDEKRETMKRFADGEVQVLIATGVIEVGIDVPNATLMTIESAERFGLSQLHQLRGRVGRGQHPGFVTAFASDGTAGDIERLEAFVQSSDGFEIARADMQLRGPGNLLSTKQTGFPPLRIADLIRDEAVLVEAQAVARSLIDQDPNLARPEFARLRKLVVSRYGKALDLSDVG